MSKRAITAIMSLALWSSGCGGGNSGQGANLGILLAPVWVPALLVYCATGGDCSVKFGSSNSVKTPSLSEIRSEGPTTWQRANEGNAAAQKEMGVRYQSGDWVVQDDEQADMWFTLAADGGNHEAVVLRDELEKRMTPEQIAEARKRAQEWKPTPTTAPAI